MTPSGTRTRSIVMPFGRVQLSVTAPTGSARSRTVSMPSAIAATRLPSSDRRSRKADVAPDAFASATSSALAARMPASLSRIAFAIAASALSRWAAGLSASVRAAPLARAPISRMTGAISLVPSMVFSGAVMGRLSACPYHVRRLLARTSAGQRFQRVNRPPPSRTRLWNTRTSRAAPERLSSGRIEPLRE